MNERTQVVHSTGGGGALIFCVLLVLKVTETVDWSWWIITLPLWGPLALFVSVILLFLLIAGFFKLFTK